MEIHKFGGASLDGSLESMEKLFFNINNFVDRPAILVFSAFRNITNMLEHLVLFLHSNEKVRAESQKREILELHHDVILRVFRGIEANEIFNKVKALLKKIDIVNFLGKQYDSLSGEIMGIGEDLSSLIISNYFKNHKINNFLLDSRKFIVTNTCYNSEINLQESVSTIANLFTEEFVEKNPVIITTGFVGRTKEGIPSIMKREYSDVTAVTLPITFSDSDLSFWKKRGIETDDKEIPYREFIQLEEKEIKGKLLADGALDLIERYKINFSIIPFDSPESKVKVYF